MREKDLPIDRTKHVCYTKNAQKCVKKLLRRYYDEPTAAELWEKIQLQYCEYLKDEPAYLQALIFLEVMNWYDGIVIDRLWVGHSRFWVIPGTEEIPFVQTWPQVLKKRGILTLIWIAGAAVIAGIAVLL